MSVRIGSDPGEQLAAPDIDLLRHHIMPASNIRNAQTLVAASRTICSFFSSGQLRRRSRPVTISIRAIGHFAPSLNTSERRNLS